MAPNIKKMLQFPMKNKEKQREVDDRGVAWLLIVSIMFSKISGQAIPLLIIAETMV